MRHKKSVRLPKWLNIVGLVTVLPSAILALRLVWEQTILTWQKGPQMVGFSLIHGAFALLIISPIGLGLWLILILILILIGFIKRQAITRSIWIHFGFSIFLVGMLIAPEGFWQFLFASQLANSSHRAEFMAYAAARGDLATIKALVRRGVKVDLVVHRDYETALHMAARANQIEVIDYLIEKNAPLDALDRSGDSPLEEALANGATEAAKILESKGAHRIRGTEEQRQKAIADEVREDIERMDREDLERIRQQQR